jgi:hypothetical protein
VDTLAHSIERLMKGANADLDLRGKPDAEWLATELRKLYEAHPARTSNVSVRVTGTDAIEIERLNGTVRKLCVAPGRRWELAAMENASYPGPISRILADP